LKFTVHPPQRTTRTSGTKGTDDDKIKQLAKFTHKEQSIWFLNANWNRQKELQLQPETIWKYVQKFNELDLQNRDQGCALDELNAHRFLESFKDPLTVMEMRELLRRSGAISKEARPKDFPITHFLLSHFKTDWHHLVNASQGDNADEMAKVQALLREVQAAIPELEKANAESKAAHAEQVKQQKLYDDKTEDLKKRSSEGSVVQQNKGKAELAQHMATDPLPLSRAKITAEAAAKKAEKALNAANAKVEACEKQLKELALRAGSAGGSLWWMDRELQEAKRFMPQKKGGVTSVKTVE
jgi:hypothetical protein